MQADTGCKINVSPGQEVERHIGLIGSLDAIERAKEAIMEKVRTVVSLVASLPLPHYSFHNSRKRTAAQAVVEAVVVKPNNSTALRIPIISRRPSGSKTLLQLVKLHNLSPRLVLKIRTPPMAAMRTMQCCGIITSNKLNKTLKMVLQARDVTMHLS